MAKKHYSQRDVGIAGGKLQKHKVREEGKEVNVTNVSLSGTVCV